MIRMKMRFIISTILSFCLPPFALRQSSSSLSLYNSRLVRQWRETLQLRIVKTRKAKSERTMRCNYEIRIIKFLILNYIMESFARSLYCFALWHDKSRFSLSLFFHPINRVLKTLPKNANKLKSLFIILSCMFMLAPPKKLGWEYV